ncbi:MAG: DUF898 family protein [Aquabacterium sp.]|nr:MAG: DUF898 family protein [Aquabacterium sp.]
MRQPRSQHLDADSQLGPATVPHVSRIDTSSFDTTGAASSVIGGSWIGVDETDVETAQGVRVDGEVQRDLDTISRALDDLGLSRCAPEDAQRWPLHVVVESRRYAGVWFLNLLLTIVTAGFYYPWARLSRLQYLDAHTLVAGMPMGFHGDPTRLTRGMLALFIAVCSVAGVLLWRPGAYAWAAWVALLWLPALAHARIRHRLQHTSWQGLIFDFSASWAAAYWAHVLPLLLGLAACLLIDQWPHQAGVEQTWMLADGVAVSFVPSAWFGAAAGLLSVAACALAPLALWMVLRYRQSSLQLGPLRTEWHVEAGLLYRTAGPLVAAWVAWLLLAVGIWIGLSWAASEGHLGPHGYWVASGCAAALAWLTAFLPRALTQARLQNLVWAHTGNRYLRFRSALATGPYAQLLFKHHLLALLTLGFYTPWAAVAQRRARLGAVFVISRIVPDELVVGLHNPASQLDSRFVDEMTGLRLGW